MGLPGLHLADLPLRGRVLSSHAGSRDRCDDAGHRPRPRGWTRRHGRPRRRRQRSSARRLLMVRVRSAELDEAGFDDSAAERAGEFGETFAVAVTQGGVGGKGREVGATTRQPCAANAGICRCHTSPVWREAVQQRRAALGRTRRDRVGHARTGGDPQLGHGLPIQTDWSVASSWRAALSSHERRLPWLNMTPNSTITSRRPACVTFCGHASCHRSAKQEVQAVQAVKEQLRRVSCRTAPSTGSSG